MLSLSQFRRPIALDFLALVASAAAVMLRPKSAEANPANRLNLEQAIQKQFGECAKDPLPLVVIANPQQRELFGRLYSQTLELRCIGCNDDLTVLSIANCRRSGEGMARHKPEICCPAQGFLILTKSAFQLQLGDKTSIQARRLVAKADCSIDQITYWLVVGGSATSFDLPMKFQQLKVGATRVMTDCLLFRTSTIYTVHQAVFERQLEFV